MFWLAGALVLLSMIFILWIIYEDKKKRKDFPWTVDTTGQYTVVVLLLSVAFLILSFGGLTRLYNNLWVSRMEIFYNQTQQAYQGFVEGETFTAYIGSLPGAILEQDFLQKVSWYNESLANYNYLIEIPLIRDVIPDVSYLKYISTQWSIKNEISP